ncbi:MAG: hypothetical protein R2759_03265 [Bacteroidales bacterium]
MIKMFTCLMMVAPAPWRWSYRRARYNFIKLPMVFQNYRKPGIEDGCEFEDEAGIFIAVEDAIRRHQGKNILFATHHPLISAGNHGGYFPASRMLFPLLDENKNLYIPLPVLFIQVTENTWAIFRIWSIQIISLSGSSLQFYCRNTIQLCMHPGMNTIYNTKNLIVYPTS